MALMRASASTAQAQHHLAPAAAPALLLLPAATTGCRRRAAQRPFTAATPRSRNNVVARAQQQVQDRIATQTIDDLSQDYCDDFECTSSPAVEQTVRAFARDTQRLRYSPSLFQPDASYSDGVRSFKGSSKYAKQLFLQQTLQRPTVTIVRMRMLDKGAAQVDWRVQGSLGVAGQVDLTVTSTITMNLLTGRITNHKEAWDLSRLSPPAALLASLQRAGWSLMASGSDASEGASKAIDDGLASLEGGGAGQGDQYNRDPTDPTKFFQGNQGDSQWQDYVSFATLAALLYLLYRSYAELAQLQ